MMQAPGKYYISALPAAPPATVQLGPTRVVQTGTQPVQVCQGSRALTARPPVVLPGGCQVSSQAAPGYKVSNMGAKQGNPLTYTYNVQTSSAGSDLELVLNLTARQKASPDERDKAYLSFINALASWGVLDNLPKDASGILHVSAPFCHDFFEATLLLPFLSARELDSKRASSISATGSDIKDQPFWWRAWEQWVQHSFGGRVQLSLKQQDLEKEQPTPAGLIIAAHPEVTNGGPWPAILANVLRSRVPGACWHFPPLCCTCVCPALQGCAIDHAIGSAIDHAISSAIRCAIGHAISSAIGRAPNASI